MSDQLENLKPEDLSSGDRPLSIPPELPILPLRDTVLFPNSFMPLAVARESSVRLIDDAIANGKLIAVFTQRDASVEEPTQADLYPVGTATHIHKMFKLPDGSLRLIVQGLQRVTLDEIISTQPYLRGKITAAVEGTTEADALEIDALARNIKTNFQQVVSLSPLLSDDLQTLATNISEPGRLADFIASSLSTISTAVKQDVLETLDIRARMDNLNRILNQKNSNAARVGPSRRYNLHQPGNLSPAADSAPSRRARRRPAAFPGPGSESAARAPC